MTAFHRSTLAGLGLVLLCGLGAGCSTTPKTMSPEVIPAQVCGGDLDSDGDGIINCNDACPNSPGRANGPDGCPLPEPEPVLAPKPYRG